MKQLSLVKNERGSIALLATLAIVIISGLVILQSSTLFRGVQLAHEKDRLDLETSQRLQTLGFQVFKAEAMAKISPDCSVFKGKFRSVVLESSGGGSKSKGSASAQRLCVPAAEGFCFQEGESRRVCASALTEVLGSVPKAPTLAAVPKLVEKKSKSGDSASKSRPRINRLGIPPTTNSVWKSCGGTEPCLRLALCPEGKTNCRLSEAVASQVVHLRATQ